MLPASNSGVGMNIGFPDVCVTPVGPVPTPIPYPNLALNATAVPFAPNVLISFVPALNMGAQMPMTLGDQAGTLSPFMGPGRYTMGNPIVMVNALPAINLLCPTTGNNMINALGAVLVPSITNVFYSHAAAPPPGAVDAGAVSGLARALDGAVEAVLEEGVVRITIPVFSAGVPATVYSALQRAGGRARAVVLDLRGCPGGDLHAAIELGGDFLDRGRVIATVTDGEGDEIVYRARHDAPCLLPLALLVDAGTASAAEVLAGALQAHGRARLVGARTHGKGTAQALVPGFAAPDARYTTVAAVTLPDGTPIEGRGLVPDVAVDPAHALDAAVSLLLSPDEAR